MKALAQWFSVFAPRISDPLILIGMDGVVIAANDAVAEWFDVSPRLLAGRRLQDIVSSGADAVARHLALWSATTSPLPGALLLDVNGAARRVRCHGARVVAPNGATAVLVTMARPSERDRFGVLTQQITLLNREIADRKHAETQREALVAELSRAVRLSEMLMAILGHDLRNPLGAIITAAHLARARSADPQLHGYVERIQRSANRMSRLINQLLDVTRLRLGRGMSVVRRRADLAAVVQHVVAEVSAAHPGRQVAVEVQGDVEGHWDVDRLEQLVANLLANAWEHGAAGAPVRVTVDGDGGDEVAISVTNEGPPIPRERLPRLFEPFEQGDGSRGFGLGLYIAREIARAHGGEIRAQSDAGLTVFTVSLPRAAQAAPPVEEPAVLDAGA